MTSEIFDGDLIEKRRELLDQGIDLYPHTFRRTHTLTEVRDRQEELVGKEVTIAGRLTAFRDAGKLVFADLRDERGRLQVMFRKNEFDEDTWRVIKKKLDLGDFVGVRGEVFHTKRGELSVRPVEFRYLAKTVVRVPIQKAKDDQTWFQLTDPETKYRERYLHWITDPSAMKQVEVRSRTISAVRRFMEAQGFLEVTTPTIEMLYGGAEARPFRTTIHALSGQEAFLRISPELPLKRFIVGGFEKVYTVCQNFRNEGIDRSHNPEFTMIEWYEAYTDYRDQMERFESLVSSVAGEVTGSPKVTYQGRELDFTPPWPRLTVLGALRDRGVDAGSMDIDAVVAECERREIPTPKPLTWGHCIAALFEHLVEPELDAPTFVCDFPLDISPLTKVHREDPRLVERFEPIVAGMELGNAYTELTDPVEQLERLRRQKELGADEEGVEHHPIDLDFVKALACGMPPTGGVGLGLDRLVMILADAHSIRDVIAFPLMRPRE